MNIAHITRLLRNSQQARLTVQDATNIFWSVKVVCVLHQVRNDSWVDIPCTRSHHDTAKWCESHRCIYRNALVNCCDRSSVTDMASDKLEFFNRTSQNFSSFLGYILMAGTVSSVLANLVFSVIFSRNRIAICFFRHSCMERGVKDHHAGNVWQNFSKSTDACSVGWIMQWSQKRQLLYLLNYFFINES